MEGVEANTSLCPGQAPRQMPARGPARTAQERRGALPGAACHVPARVGLHRGVCVCVCVGGCVGWGGGAAPQRAARDLPAESLWLGAADDGWRLACSAAQHLGHFEGR